MIKEEVIPFIIPNSKKHDGFRMLPNMIINQINKLFVHIKKQIDIDKEIEIEQNRNTDHFIYYYEMYNIIRKGLYDLFINKHFWKNNMNYKVCEHIITTGEYAGLFCGNRIDINCKENKYRCATHIGTKYHKPKKRNIEEYNRCIKFNKHNERCGNPKKYGDICKKHYSKLYNININDVDRHYNIQNEINILHNIVIDQINTSLLKSKRYCCNIFRNVILKDKYENNGYKDIKLICYNILENNIINEKTNIYNIEKDSEKIVQCLGIGKRPIDCFYYSDNNFKKRKINYKIENEILYDLKFSFRYNIMNYYMNKIKKENRTFLNKILKYIIHIRNSIFNNEDYIYNKTYVKIIFISNKILNII